MFSISLTSRDLAAAAPIHLPGLAWTVEQLAWRATGGADTARLRVVGADETRLFALADALRFGLTVQDDLGPAWWGYLSAVTFYGGAAPLRIDLAACANRVSARYHEITPYEWSGPAAQTGWLEDAESQAAYGVREQVYQLGSSSAADAAALAAAMLASFRQPGLQPLAPGKLRGADQSGSHPAGWRWAIVEAKGWWSALDWRYYAEPRGRASHLAAGTASPFGHTSAVSKLAGSFQCGVEGWSAAEAWVRLKRYRAVDAVRLDLCADSAGVPGGVLASAQVSASALADDWTWARFAFPGAVALAANTPYWLVLSRTGALNSGQYYNASVDEGLGYPVGMLRLWNGAAWTTRSPDADLNFLVSGSAETTAQLERMLNSAAVFNDVRIETPSAITTRLYRDGTLRTRAEAEALLALGAADGSRLLSTVERDRTARVYAAPDAESPTAFLGPDRSLRDASGRPLHPSQAPVGQWIRLGANVPAGSPPVVFAESVAWAESTGWTVGD